MIKKLTFAFLMLLVAFSSVGCGTNKVTNAKWLDFGHGMVNVNNFKVIRIGIDRVRDMITAELEDSFSRSLTGSAISTNIYDLTEEKWKKEYEGKGLAVSGYILFDDFKLIVISSEVSNYAQFNELRDSLNTKYAKFGDFVKSDSAYLSVDSL